MRKFFLLLLVITLSFSCKSDKKEKSIIKTETTVYYLIRHAEKDRTTKKDPSLTEKGLKRAANWAKLFKEIPFDLIYSTNYKRTQQTALPTALEKNLNIQSYDPEKLYNKDFKIKTKGKTVLVVGHSNTTPVFVNAIIGKNKYNQIDDRDNGKLFIVTITNNETSVVVENHN